MDCDTRVVKHSADDEKDKYVVTLKGSAVIDGEQIDVEVKLTAKTDLLINTWPRGTLTNTKIGASPQQKLHQR